MERYDINNNVMTVAYCMKCGHEVGVQSRLELMNAEKSKALGFEFRVNNLMVLDLIMGCCEKASYSYR